MLFHWKQHPGAPEWHLLLLSFNFSERHICITHLNVQLWSVLSSSYHTIKISSVMPHTLGRSSNMLSNFPGTCHLLVLLWMVALGMCTWHAKVVRYEDIFHPVSGYGSQNWKSISDRYCTFISLGNISLMVGPLCTGLIHVFFEFCGILAYVDDAILVLEQA